MKKINVVSFIAVIASFVGLVLLSVTGMKVHIAISIIALAIMVVCTILDKKNWKKPALEIVYRLAYLITLITGIVMIKAQIAGALSIIHKITAAAFVILFVVNFVLTGKQTKADTQEKN